MIRVRGDVVGSASTKAVFPAWDKRDTHMAEAAASSVESDAGTVDRRALLKRLAATSAVAWAAPEVLATRRASAAPLSGCYTDYDFDDGTFQGWTVSNGSGAGWQISSLHPNSGGYSAWFGRAGTSNSRHPIRGEPSFRYRSRSVRGTLTSPATLASSTDIVCFEVRLAIESAPQYDVFRFFIVQGGTRRELWTKSDGPFSVIDHPENPGQPWDLLTSNGSYAHVEVLIGTPSGIDLSNPVQFEFDFQSVDGNYNRTEGIYLDNILLPCGAAAPGPASSSPTLSLPSATSNDGYVPPPTAPTPEQREPPPA